MEIQAQNITASEFQFNAFALEFQTSKEEADVVCTKQQFIMCEHDLHRIKCTEIIEHENAWFLTIYQRVQPSGVAQHIHAWTVFIPAERGDP